MAALEPLITAALQVSHGETDKIRTVVGYAQSTAANGRPDLGLKALDTLEQLLFSAAFQLSLPVSERACSRRPTRPLFLSRLAAVIARLNDTSATTQAAAIGLISKVGEASALAHRHEIERAHALLDDVERLLEAATAP